MTKTSRKVVIARRVERFSGNRLATLIEGRGFTKPDFLRACIRQAPSDLKPTQTYLYDTLSGALDNPGANYITLFAKVLECSRDEFFEKVVN